MATQFCETASQIMLCLDICPCISNPLFLTLYSMYSTTIGQPSQSLFRHTYMYTHVHVHMHEPCKRQSHLDQVENYMYNVISYHLLKLE